ncbi:MAG TPA: secondary thiamine-phosphate synthase enzyme YjbQ [Candidatus Hydrogenedentes bacterium]|nr:secondary thiamine-phosphate synthase enzyme YjbQ [Candidatus Hydrogenedentota bacterium]
MNNFTLHTRLHTEFVNIDNQVQEIVSASGCKEGIVHVYIPHTTAGITINENADPDVVADIETVLNRLVPWKAGYAHCEGNAAAHVKASLMGATATVIIHEGRLALGTWQSLYFCEFDGPRTRKVWIKIIPS